MFTLGKTRSGIQIRIWWDERSVQELLENFEKIFSDRDWFDAMAIFESFYVDSEDFLDDKRKEVIAYFAHFCRRRLQDKNILDRFMSEEKCLTVFDLLRYGRRLYFS